jgi:hypothetical protein
MQGRAGISPPFFVFVHLLEPPPASNPLAGSHAASFEVQDREILLDVNIRNLYLSKEEVSKQGRKYIQRGFNDGTFFQYRRAV